MMHPSSRVLASALVAASLAAALVACNKDHAARASGEDEARDLDRDSPKVRAIGEADWYTEQRRPRSRGAIWSHDYRAYLLDVARAERLRWPELMAGAKSPRVIGGSQWTNLGPTQANSPPNGPDGGGGPAVTDAGRINAIIPDGARLFIATAGGGVWRRENNAWTPLTETVGTLSAGSLAMDPTNHDRLYLGLGDPFSGTGTGVLISTDGGDDWSDPILLGDSMIIPQIIVDPTTPSIVLAGTDQGLYRSTNSGASWSKVAIATGLATGPFVWSIASTGGKGFTLALGENETDSYLTQNGQVWYSADDGATWKRSTGVAAQTAVGRITVASAPSQPQTVYAMAADSSPSNNDLYEIYKSANGGQSWTALGIANKNIPNSPESNQMSALTNAQGWYDLVVQVDPSNPSLVYFGGALMGVKTTDGGATFSAIADWLGSGAPYVHADFHSAAIDASGLYFGTDGGLFQSTDGGGSFSNALNVGLVTHLLYSVCSSPAAPTAVLGGMQDNGTRLRVGTTSTFNEVIGADGFGCAISRTSGQKMMGSVYYDQIESSSNGGQSFNDATNGINGARDGNSAPFNTTIVPWEGAASTGNELYTFTFSTVYKTTNFGSSWTALPTNPPQASGGEIRNIGVAASNQSIVGVVGSGGFVALSKDGGATWTTVANGKGTDATALPNSDRSLSWIHFDVSNANTVYVASVAPEASVNHLWKSTDFGAHWASIDGNGLPVGVPINVIKSDPKPANGQPGKILYAGTHMGVYRSTDGGATWSRFGAGMPLVSVTDLYISPDESIVRAASYGRGFWELTAPANDFSIAASPAVTVLPGASGPTTVTTAVTNGVAQSIALTASGLPSGATAQFAPTSVNAGGSSTLTLTAGAQTPAGTYTVTITGASPMATHATTVSFTVEATNDFTLTVDPATVTVAPGANGTTTVTTALAAGAAETIALTVDGLPPGVTAGFSPTGVTAGNASTLTLTVDASALVGTYGLTVTGTSPSTSHSASLSLVVGGNDDFSITLVPASLDIGVDSHDGTMVQTMVTSGSAETLTLTVDGLPQGATADFDNPTFPSGDDANLSITTGPDTPVGTSTVTVTATGPSGTHTAALALTVGTPGVGADGGQPGGCCQSGAGGGSGATALALVVLGLGFVRRRRA